MKVADPPLVPAKPLAKTSRPSSDWAEPGAGALAGTASRRPRGKKIPWGADSDRLRGLTAIRTDLGAIFVSLELSRAKSLITFLSPGGREKMSKHTVAGGDVAALFGQFGQFRAKARARTGRTFPLIVIQKAGLDGFRIHRLLEAEGIESHVADAASIATSRRRRRAETDKIDGEALVRDLPAFKRGEPRVCSMVRAPSPEEEDHRRLCREPKALIGERVRRINRIKGLLFAQGIGDYEPEKRDRRAGLDELRTGDDRDAPAHLETQSLREIDRLELLMAQVKVVKAERDALLRPEPEAAHAPAAGLTQLRGVGPEFATVLWAEGLYRAFDNRRKITAYAGLAATSWRRRRAPCKAPGATDRSFVQAQTCPWSA
jgi:transposase